VRPPGAVRATAYRSGLIQRKRGAGQRWSNHLLL